MWAVPAYGHKHNTPTRLSHRVSEGALWLCTCGRGFEVANVVYSKIKDSRDNNYYWWPQWINYIGPLEELKDYEED